MKILRVTFKLVAVMNSTIHYFLDHVETRNDLYVRNPNLVKYYKLIPGVYGWLSQQLGEFSLKELLPQHGLQMLIKNSISMF